jgi:putative multiple sugar transport system permease protein
MSGIKDLKKVFGGSQSNARQFGMIATLVVAILIFQVLTGGLTLDPPNLIALVSQYSYILILAIGMVMVIVAGHIDLSVGSVAAFVGIMVATSMTTWNFPGPWPSSSASSSARRSAPGRASGSPTSECPRSS